MTVRSIVFTLLFLPMLCLADTITIDGETSENLYITESASGYYVHVPEDATVIVDRLDDSYLE